MLLSRNNKDRNTLTCSAQQTMNVRKLFFPQQLDP